MSEKDFWDLGANEYEALLNRFNQKERLENYRTASLICTLVNLIAKPETPFNPDDFMDTPEQEQEMSEQDMTLMLKSLYTSFAGGDSKE